MSRVSRLLLAFTIAFTTLLIAPALLDEEFSFYTQITWGDVADLFTPLVLIPLYWLTARGVGRNGLRVGEGLVFIVLAALWVEGQGMHLSANSIGHLVEESTNRQVYALTKFYDEALSHYLWHGGMVGLSGLAIWHDWKKDRSSRRKIGPAVVLGGALHGFTLFLVLVEGGTASLVVPFAVVTVAVILGWSRYLLSVRPVVTFFLVAYGVALVLTASWAVYWGGLPEFSEVGLI